MSDFKPGVYVKGEVERYAASPANAVALEFDGFVRKVEDAIDALVEKVEDVIDKILGNDDEVDETPSDTPVDEPVSDTPKPTAPRAKK